MGPHEFLEYVHGEHGTRPDTRMIAIGGTPVGYLALLQHNLHGDYTVLSAPNKNPADTTVATPLGFSRTSRRVDASGRDGDTEGNSWGWVHVRTNDVTVSIPGNTNDSLGPKFDDGWPDPDLSLEYLHPEMEAGLDARLARQSAGAGQAAGTAQLPADTVQ